MAHTPVTLSQALAAFTDIYSPRIVGRVNDYDVRIAHVRGDHLWHVHETTDEFFLVLDGDFDVSLREGGLVRTVSLHGGDIFVVPAGTEHKPSSSGGSILMFEPSGTLSTGDRHEGEIPAHVDSTTGHDIADEHPEAEHMAEDAAVPPLVAAATLRAREAGFPYSCEPVTGRLLAVLTPHLPARGAGT
jgi:mannose-6-phosphate isomerase-like protein (cupin superfamily)